MTLLEALVAMAIASGMIATAAQGFSQSTRQSLNAQWQIEATLLAESLLARAGEDLPLRSTAGTETVTPLAWWLDVEAVGTGVYQVKSRVEIVRGGAKHLATMSSLKIGRAGE